MKEESSRVTQLSPLSPTRGLVFRFRLASCNPQLADENLEHRHLYGEPDKQNNVLAGVAAVRRLNHCSTTTPLQPPSRPPPSARGRRPPPLLFAARRQAERILCSARVFVGYWKASRNFMAVTSLPGTLGVECISYIVLLLKEDTRRR